MAVTEDEELEDELEAALEEELEAELAAELEDELEAALEEELEAELVAELEDELETELDELEDDPLSEEVPPQPASRAVVTAINESRANMCASLCPWESVQVVVIGGLARPSWRRSGSGSMGTNVISHRAGCRWNFCEFVPEFE